MPPDGRRVLNNQGTDDYVLTLFFMRGLFEWDDMIHNGLGCMIGCMVTNYSKRKIIRRIATS